MTTDLLRAEESAHMIDRHYPNAEAALKLGQSFFGKFEMLKRCKAVLVWAIRFENAPPGSGLGREVAV